MLWILFCVTLALACSPLGVGARWSVRWSQFLFSVVALLGHQALLDLHRSDARLSLGGGLCVLPGVAVLLLSLGVQAGYLVQLMWQGGLLAAVWWLLWIGAPQSRLRVTSLLSVAILLASLSLQSTPDSTETQTQPNYPVQVPALPPLGSDRVYLSLYTINEYVQWTRPTEWNLLRPGNRAMVAGERLLNGYDSLDPVPMSESVQMSFVGSLTELFAKSLLQEAGPQGLLARWGVDGLLVSPTFKPAAEQLLPGSGWVKSFEAARTSVWLRARLPECYGAPDAIVPEQSLASLFQGMVHKSGASVSVFVPDDFQRTDAYGRFGSVQVRDFKSLRNGLEALVITDEEARSLLVFRRVYVPGYQATLDGKPVRVGSYDGVNLAVMLPAHSAGVLRVFYRPRGLGACELLAALGILLGALEVGGYGSRALAAFQRTRLLDHSRPETVSHPDSARTGGEQEGEYESG